MEPGKWYSLADLIIKFEDDIADEDACRHRDVAHRTLSLGDKCELGRRKIILSFLHILLANGRIVYREQEHGKEYQASGAVPGRYRKAEDVLPEALEHPAKTDTGLSWAIVQRVIMDAGSITEDSLIIRLAKCFRPYDELIAYWRSTMKSKKRAEGLRFEDSRLHRDFPGDSLETNIRRWALRRHLGRTITAKTIVVQRINRYIYVPPAADRQ
jgi:hypothetical protein